MLQRTARNVISGMLRYSAQKHSAKYSVVCTLNTTYSAQLYGMASSCGLIHYHVLRIPNFMVIGSWA